MWKKYKTTLILTTLISLFPMVIGLLLWNRMPDTIATHFWHKQCSKRLEQQNDGSDRYSSVSCRSADFLPLFSLFLIRSGRTSARR